MLLLSGIGFSQRGIGNRIPSICLTIEGERCIFPFMFKGQKYNKCTYKNSPTPWCASMLDGNLTVITNRWGDCNTDIESSCEVEVLKFPSCTTRAGPSPNRPCIFPFRHNGKTYSGCTTDTLGQPWCSTATYTNGSHISGQGKYGLCPSTCPGAEGFTRDEECVPGSTLTKGCNSCICSSTGEQVCTSNTCNNDCVPGSIMTDDCNTCICSSTGEQVCTMNICKETCVPGSTWTKDCNTCICSSSGAAVCTEKACFGSCTAVSGPAKGRECVFPFSWGGQTYQACTPWTYGGEDQGKEWCSTKTDDQGGHVNGKGYYGFCGADCSVPETGISINERTNLVTSNAVMFPTDSNQPPN